MARKGFRGYPVATVAYYGPDNREATKVAVGIVNSDGEEPAVLMRWWSEKEDTRLDEKITKEILEFINEHGAVSVAAVPKLLGCPHETGTDYPEGEDCPHCPFWAGKDRWEGVEISP